ncbi:predicted protein [Chaetomium globosum CBS 148.51]|uniref:Uncharacterized protein n=1 Tax=Chaetomium globosum (strain ATCC 6205 / CBS 148.51 / DSM 1962 / NBRC 6347 / NRRL 1970) TaxID=306901 RepID=Q2GNL5_CHAGB|nr:uncharacterized protein CHGG_10439 [Chaetomium globosum CBS 148.51]EAQ84035.1 predicted protein [Chaetomium globosum CBS 148.51]
MPRFHTDSDSDDYVPRHHQRSPRRRSPTPGPPVDDRHPRFEFEPHTPFYPPVASGAAGPGPRRSRSRSRSRSAGPPDTYADTYPATTMPADSTILAHRRRARDRDRERARTHRSRSSSTSSVDFSYPTDSDYDSLRPHNRRNHDHHHRDHHRRSNSHSNSHSPLHKAHSLLSSTFTPSTSGLGVGVLGAIVGGLAAREASEAVAAGREEHAHSHSHSNHHGHGGYGHGGRHHHHERRRSGDVVVGGSLLRYAEWRKASDKAINVYNEAHQTRKV